MALDIRSTILFTPQELSEEQKKIARENIGATDEAGSGLDPNNAALTGTTTADAISPNVHAIGNVGTGQTATLHATKQYNTVTFTGSSALIQLPANPGNVSRVLTATITGNVTLVLTLSTALPRLGNTATDTTITFDAATNKVVEIGFKADADAFKYYISEGDSAKIQSSSLAGLQTNPAATPSATEFYSTTAMATVIAAALDGLTIDGSSRINGLATGELIVGVTGSTATKATLGSGLSYNSTTKVISATAAGATSAVDISGTDIDFSVGQKRKKTLSGAVTFTVSNLTESRVDVFLTASGASRSPGFTGVDFGTAGTPTIADGKSAWVQLLKMDSGVLGVTLSNGITIDIVQPTFVSTEIPALGTTVEDLYSETLSGTITTAPTRTITLSGGAVTLSSPTVSTNKVIWTPSRTILPGETCSANACSNPSDGIRDTAGNAAVSFTGRQADVTNNSAASAYQIAERFSGTGVPSGFTAGGGSPDFDYVVASDLSPRTGNQCLRVTANSFGPYASFTAMDECYVACRFRDTTLALRLRNGTTNVAFWQYQSSNNRAYIGGSYTPNTGSAPAAGTTYYLKMHYRRGITANSQNQFLRVWLTTSNSDWGSPVVTRDTSGDSSSVDRCYFGPEVAATSLYDDFILSATDIPIAALTE